MLDLSRMNDYTFNTKELESLAYDLSKSAEKTKREIQRVLFVNGRKMVADAKEAAPSGVSARGEKLKPNIISDVPVWTKLILGVRDTVKHAASVEFGSKPHFPPVAALTGREEALDKWVRLKLGASRKQAQGIAFSIARKIARRGTRPQPYLTPAFEKHLNNIYFGVLEKLSESIKK